MSRLLPLIEPLEARYAPATLSISVDPATIIEGASGTKTITFKVTLSEAPTTPVTVGFFTADGTATIGDHDYVFNSGLLTFEPAASGQTADLEQEITVVVNSDTKFETDENFRVVLHHAVGADLANGQAEMAASATITNDDTRPTISIGDAAVIEGDFPIGGPGTPQKMIFTVSLSNASHEAVTVTLNTSDDTALAGPDYVAKLGQTITFAPGETSKTFEVDINGDTIGETNEAFKVTLSNPTNATLNENAKVGTGTINNDDAIIRVADVRVAEGTPSANTGNKVQMIFTVTLDRAGKSDVVTVHYDTAAGTATAGTDYINVSGDLTFQPGETSKQVIVEVNKDAIFENDETLFLNLSNATHAFIEDAQATGTIANDEIQASLTLLGDAPLRKKEKEFSDPVIYRVTLSSAPTDPAGVDVELLFGGNATVSKDYLVNGYTVTEDGKIMVHFAPGETSKDINLTVTDDQLASDDETAQVSISKTVNAVTNSSSSQASFTILNDDAKAFLIIDDLVSVTEGAGAKAKFTVHLSTAVEDGDVTFSFNTVNGTAIAGSDFTSTTSTGKITVKNGNLSTEIEVPLMNDEINEKDEKFTVQISGGTGGATTANLSAKTSASATIVDDDARPTIGFESTDIVKIVEGDNGTKLVTLKVKLSTVSGREVSVRAMGINGTAISGQDFVFDQVIKIAAGQTEATFTVPVNGDTADEIDENFFVKLSEGDGATIEGGKDQVEVSILNNDRQISIGDVTVSEGAGVATFIIRLNAASLHPISVKFKTSNGTAIGTIPGGANDDYVPTPEGFPAIVFAPGETEKQVTVNLVGDMTAENAETFFGELFDPTNASISVAKGTATITNDDAAFRISDARLVEGPAGANSTMLFTVKREGPANGQVTVNFVTQNGTAVQGLDFLQSNGTLTFADGEMEKTIAVTIVGDSTSEGESENFSVKLSNPSQGTLLDDTGVGTIVDDEGALVSISDKQIIEGNDGTKKMIFVVTVTGTVNGTVRLNYATEAGTATTSDFTTTSGTLTFTTAGSQSIEVPIIGDTIHEGDQDFLVKLTTASGSATVNMVDDTAVGTIQDDDAAPVITSTGGKIIEGNSGQSEVQFVIKLDRASEKPVTVEFALGNTGTASAGEDYINPFGGVSKTITFLPGQTEVHISVPVLGDTNAEQDETIDGVLSNPTNGTIGASTPAIIQNDEIQATIGNGTLIENAPGRGHMTINLSGPSSQPVKVTFVVENGTAIRGTDFAFFDTDGAEGNAFTFDDATGVGTVTIPANQTSVDIEFTMIDDTAAPKFEGPETFTVKLTDVTNAAIGGTSTGTFTITENEQLTIKVSDQFLFEGETTTPVIGTPTAPGKVGGPFSDPPPEPTVKNVQITISLSGPAERAITVKASSFLDSETTALAGSDFQAFSDTEITFAPGETSKTITVGIIDDQIDELAETFKIKLEETTPGSALGATIEAPGKIQILDNDLRGISIGDSSIVEGSNGASKLMTFTVKLSAASTKAISVKAATLSSGAQAGVDFSSAIGGNIDENGLITFLPGETEKTITVEVFDDKPLPTLENPNPKQLAEGDENFVIALTDATLAVITDSQATGRIITDEIIYKLTANKTNVLEGGSLSDRTVTFTVTRAFASGFGTDPSEQQFLSAPGSVSFETADGTAKAPGDYGAASGTVQFAAGETSKTFTVVVNNDTAFENNENFVVKLTGSTGGALVNDAGLPQSSLESTITIQNDDTIAPTLSINDVRKVELQSGTSALVFTVSLSAPNETGTITVDFATEDGTATSLLGDHNFQDFLAKAGKLTFAPGETSKTITIDINGDDRDEADEETFKVKLSNAKFTDINDPETVGTIGITDPEGVGTITDDDATPTLIFDGATNGVFTVVEGNNGTATFIFKLKLSNPSEKDITFDISLLPNGTAKEGFDFMKSEGFPTSITIPAGKTTAEIVVDGQSQPQEIKFDIVGDSIDEVNESFQVKVTKSDSSQGAVQIPISTATVTISDDDAAPRLAINDVFLVEGDSGTQKLIFTVSIDGQSDRPITVDFSTLDGTAVAGGAVPDYIALSGKLTFQPGDTLSKTIEIDVYGDVYKEVDETFQVKLSNAVNATIARDTGTGTIQQDEGDSKVFLSIKDAKVVEGGNGTTKTATFRVELSAAADTDVVFNAKTRPGTGVAGSDFIALDQEFTIPKGSTSVDITVTVQGDNVFEATESFFVKLSNVTNNVEVVGDGEGRGTIFNDDVLLVNSKMVRYVDVDGDLVTLRITKGSFLDKARDVVTLVTAGSTVGGQLLQKLDFRGNPSAFNGTSVFVTVEPQPGFRESGGVSDGKADVGFIFGASVGNDLEFSQGIDFTNIVIEGDLGGIQAGDRFITPSIRGHLSADSIGVKSGNLPTDAPGNFAFFLSKVNAIKTAGDVSATIQMVGRAFGDIGTLTIGGALRALSDTQAASVIFSGSLNHATIGQIVGGTTDFSGSIRGSTALNTTIGSIKVLDGIVGGSGAASGSISARTINFVSVGSEPTSEQNGIFGGSGQTSGAIFASQIGQAVIGSPNAPAEIKGGTESTSGLLNANVIGSVTLYGDLIGGSDSDAGEIFAAKLGSLRIVGSVIGGSAAGAGSVFSSGTGNVNSITITGGITGGSAEKTGYVNIGGSVGSLTIGSDSPNANGALVGGSKTSTGMVEIAGSLSHATINGDLRGGSDATSGVLKVGGNLGSFTINGDLVGGTASNAGQVTAAHIGSARVNGSVIGGSGTSSGSILSTGTGRVNSVTVTESLLGGSGERSGSVKLGGGLGSLTIGSESAAEEDRNLVGGGGASSGLVEVAGSLSKVTIHGDLRGGTSSSSGGLKVGGAIDTITIGGNFEGGPASATGQQTGFITAERIARMTIKGDWTSGASSGLADSGSIRVVKDIGNLVVEGDVLGTSSSRVVLAAAGNGSNQAIGNLSFGGKVEFMDILAGYGGNATGSKPLGDLVNADASIKSVTVEKDILATNIVAGVGPGLDGRFGTSDDQLGTLSNNANIVSLIAKVTINGAVGETAEAYGIVAQQVKSVSVGGTEVELLKGPSNDKGADSKPIGGRPTFRVVEI